MAFENRSFLSKRNICALTAVFLMVTMLAGCGKNASSEVNQSSSGGEQSLAETDVPQESQDVFAMDTYMTVTAYGEQAKEAVDEAVAEIQRLDDLWSVGDSDSEVSKLNSMESAILSDETAVLLEKSLELYKETDGAFDITIYPLMEAWGFTSGDFKVPSQEEIDQLLKYVDAGAINYDASEKSLNLPDNVQIDFGGIAKGYTSAHIMDIFAKYDVNCGLVSLGGNVQAYKTKIDGSNWKVGIENPDQTVGQLSKSDYVGVLEIADKAVITSGGYERYFEEDGKIYHHILDPQTGYPSDSGLLSVTIVSTDGLLADGLSTSLFIMGQEKALDFWREHKDEFDAILVNDQGEITITEGLKDSFSSDLKYELAK